MTCDESFLFGGKVVRRHRAALWLTLCAPALLAGCGSGDGSNSSSLVSQYLSQFPAPAAVTISVLTAGFAGASGANVVANATALLATTAYLNTRVTLAWLRGFEPTVTGPVYAIRSSGAAFAHAAGLTGAGQLIAISDEHMSPGHAVFAGKTVTVDSNGPTVDEHGTSVASVAAGKSANFIGTAPDANILFGTFLTDQSLTSLGQRATALGAVAWNNSWTYTGFYVNQTAFNSVFSGTDGQAYLAALDAYAAQGVVVFAMSNNENETNAGIMDALPFLRPTLEAGWIAAVNGVPTFAGGDVTSVTLLSSSCLQAARWCLVADGSWNAAVGTASSYAFITGSSFAAPQISGALALLAQAFPGLSPHQLRIRLLASADQVGAADATVELATGFFKGYSVTYGHGFLDIEAALKPIGPVSMALAEGGEVATDVPVLRTGSGFGDAVEMSLAGVDVGVRDVLSAGFLMPAQALLAGAHPGARAGALLARSLQGNLAAERGAELSALADPFAAFTGPTLTMSAADDLAVASVLVPQLAGDSLGLNLTRVLADGPLRVELGVKLARDDGGLMSLDGSGGAMMASLALGITQDLGNDAFLGLSGEMGLSDLGGATALSRATTAQFNALALTLGRSGVFSAGDRLTLSVGMPVAVASGSTTLELPVYRASSAEAVGAAFEPVTVNLAPQDRQIDMSITYQTALADGLEMKLSLAHSENFGNRAGETDTGGALALVFRF